MRTVACAVAFLAVLAAGCSIIMPADQQMIHDNTLNAHAINLKVQAIEHPTPEEWAATKQWWAAEDGVWAAMDAWAQGKDPAKATP